MRRTLGQRSHFGSTRPFAAIGAVLVLAACGSSGTSSAPTDVSSTTEPTATTASPTAPASTAIAPPVAAVGRARDLSMTTPDGRTRTAHLYVPASLPDDAPLPLLIALHGGSGTGRQFERTSALDDLAEANGFLVVYPDGVGSGPGEDQQRTWNGGVCCGAAARNDVDDVAFLRQLVEYMSAEHAIDANRVFATGHSNGMIMSYRLVCEASDVFVAAAGQAGTLGVDACDPAAPVSFLHIHGLADVKVPIEGGPGEGISGVMFPPPPAGIRALADADGCPAEATVTTDPPATIETWTPCAADTTVEFVSVSGATHAWMGAATPTQPGAPEPFADYDSSVAVWTFLHAHPRA